MLRLKSSGDDSDGCDDDSDDGDDSADDDDCANGDDSAKGSPTQKKTWKFGHCPKRGGAETLARLFVAVLQ